MITVGPNHYVLGSFAIDKNTCLESHDPWASLCWRVPSLSRPGGLTGSSRGAPPPATFMSRARPTAGAPGGTQQTLIQ